MQAPRSIKQRKAFIIENAKILDSVAKQEILMIIHSGAGPSVFLKSTCATDTEINLDDPEMPDEIIIHIDNIVRSNRDALCRPVVST
jgi:hypothetical protein